MATTNINPARMEAIASMLFGRKAALTIMSGNPALKEYSLKRLEEIAAEKKPKIGTTAFTVTALVADTEVIADTFGFDRSNLKFFGGDNVKFRKVLDTMDAVLSCVNVIPADSNADIKSGVRLVAKTIQQYLPDMKSIGKLLAMAPGVSKYSKILIGFGDTLDKAIDVLNRDGNDSIREAITIMRDGLKDLYKVDIEDINRQVDEAKVDSLDDDEDETKKKSKKSKKAKTEEDPIPVENFTVVDGDSTPNNKETKREEKIMSDTTEAVAAYGQQQFYPQFEQPYGQPYQNPIDTGSYIPEFMNPNLYEVQKTVPEFISENTMAVPKVDPMDRLFQPVDQPTGQYIDPRIMDYPWVRDIQKAANNCGYMITPSIISDAGNVPVMIRIDTFGGQNNVFLPDKSFCIDLGTIIDGRIGIWNCITITGAMIAPEFCNEAYALNAERTIDNNGRKERTTVLNTSLLEKIFKFGFSNLKGSLSKGDILYGERMIVTNRVIDLITMPPSGLSKDAKNLIKGGCIRAATALAQDPAIGRLRFKMVNPHTLEFVLTNEGEPAFLLGPVENRKVIDVTFSPVLDEQGKTIPVNPKGGSDIKYSVSYNG